MVSAISVDDPELEEARQRKQAAFSQNLLYETKHEQELLRKYPNHSWVVLNDGKEYLGMDMNAILAELEASGVDTSCCAIYFVGKGSLVRMERK